MSLLSDRWLKNIIVPLWLSFYPLNSIFCTVEILNFDEVWFTNFFFCRSGFWCKVYGLFTLPYFLRSLLAFFSCKFYSFHVLHFKSRIHFELIFQKVWDWHWGSIFAYGCPVAPQPFAKKVIIPPLSCFGVFVKIRWAYFHGSMYVSSLSVPLMYVVPLPISHSLDYCKPYKSWNWVD